MNNNVKGYKVFNSNWTCRRDFQYEVGKTYEEDVDLSVCNRGFHFCKDVKDCFNYYSFDPNNKVAEIIALGEVQEEDDKCCTNKIEIVREISWEEVLRLVNTGQGCTGLSNSGDRNSGDYNTGNHNSGYFNNGDCNSGDCNTGNYNTGNRNTGNSNSGNRNTGNSNTGNRNTGNYNTGNRNTGNSNSGNYNSGNRNTGNSNTGDYNIGDWNMASQVTGCFNTKSQKLRFFDKETNLTIEEWRDSKARYLLNQINFIGTDWIHSWEMTDKEKEEHPEHETTGGYLKTSDIKDACVKWWAGLSYKEKNIIKDIPNFNAEKFFKITGIEVEE